MTLSQSEQSALLSSFNDPFHQYNLKNQATSNIKIRKIFPFSYPNLVGNFLGDGPFEFEKRIVNLHP